MEVSPLFRCQCGDYHFLEVSALDWGEPVTWNSKEFSFVFIEEPFRFWDRLKCAFGRDSKRYAREILLSEEQCRELIELLSQALEGS